MDNYNGNGGGYYGNGMRGNGPRGNSEDVGAKARRINNMQGARGGNRGMNSDMEYSDDVPSRDPRVMNRARRDRGMEAMPDSDEMEFDQNNGSRGPIGNKYAQRYGDAFTGDDMDGDEIMYNEMGEMIDMDPRKAMWRKIFLGLKIFAVIVLLVCLVGGIYFWKTYGATIIDAKRAADKIVKNSKIEDFKKTSTCTFYDADGNEIEDMKSGDRYYLTLDKIPKSVQDTFIVSEDSDFEENNGISYKGMLRAIVSIIKNKGEKTQGASTITQQLTRNIYLSFEKTMERKFKEIFISLGLTKKYDKDLILEFYINNIYFQNGYYGIESAAQGYFGKSIGELTLAEQVFLCAIPNNPTKYDPYVENSKETNIRKARLLEQLLEANIIEKKVYDEALNYKITLATSSEEKQATKVPKILKDYIMYSTVRALMESSDFVFEYGFISDEAGASYYEKYDTQYSEFLTRLNNSGYKIYTSIDFDKQNALQSAIDTNLAKNTEGSELDKESQVYNLQGSGVCIDNESGKVVAIVGARTQDNGALSVLNRALKSPRQPGSAIKPLLVYGPAFCEKDSDGNYIYTPDTIRADEKITGEEYEDENSKPPTNSDGKYSHNVTFSTAIAKSINTIPWLLFHDELNRDKCINYLHEMNFNWINSTDTYYAAALGGFSKGATAVEMAAAYAAIQYDGIYRAPSCINRIDTSSGETVLSYRAEFKVVYDQNAARRLTQCMMGVLESGGTGSNCKLDGFDSAAKTGTTTKKKDGWFCGYTHYYTTAIWVGKDDNTETESGVSGGALPGTIWQEFMGKAHSGLENVKFDLSINNTSSSNNEPVKTPEVIRTEEPIPTPSEMDVFPPDILQPTPEVIETEQPVQTIDPNIRPVVEPTKEVVETVPPEPTENPDDIVVTTPPDDVIVETEKPDEGDNNIWDPFNNQ